MNEYSEYSVDICIENYTNNCNLEFILLNYLKNYSEIKVRILSTSLGTCVSNLYKYKYRLIYEDMLLLLL